MIPKKLMRKKVLEAVNMAAGYGKTESMLREMVSDLTGEDVDLQDLRDAMERLHSERSIRSVRDEDGYVLWYITPGGSATLNTL